MSSSDPSPLPDGTLPAGVEPGITRQRVIKGWAQLWNVPNLLTLIRILLIPVFWHVLMYEQGENPRARVLAAVIFVVAAVTDYVDGALARKQGLVTTFGKIADPLADKALTGAALIGLSVLGDLWWSITFVILAREIGVTLVRFIVLKHGVIPASRGGKAKTMAQMLAILLFLLPIEADMSYLWWVRNAVMALAVALTVVTGLDYVNKAYRTRHDSKAAKAGRSVAPAVGQTPGKAPRTGGAPSPDGPDDGP